MNTFQKPVNDTLRRGPLQVHFRWHEDRFAHSLSLCKAGRQLPLLASWEGTPDQPWPPSPALQELHIESQPAGPIALLVGSTHHAHDSLAIANTETGFSFNVACRLLRSVDTSGMQSGYRAMLQPVNHAAQPEEIGVWEGADRSE